MELTIEQALRKGVAAHKKGKYQDAEYLYRTILQTQPTHPDANHNLGVLAVSLNKTKSALPFFKTALEGNPKIEQFWVSYIDALIKEKQLEVAMEVHEQAIKLGINRDKLNSLGGQIFSKTNIIIQSPCQQQINNLLEHYQCKRFNDAEKLAKSITKEFPKHQFSWKVLGAVLKAMGRINDSLVPTKKSVELAPQDAEAKYNLGNTLKELGRLKEAEASYKQAITLKPNFTEAHYNLGNALQEQVRTEEACSSYIQAIDLNPDFADAYVNLGIALKNVRFKSLNFKLYPILTQLISTGNFSRPVDLAPSILSLLKHDPFIKNLLHDKNVALNLTGATSLINNLDKLMLLHHLMRVCPLPDLQLEVFFVAIRNLILTNLGKIERTREIIYFLSTLSLHCFTNEFIYVEKDTETKLLEILENEIKQTLTKSKQPELLKVLCLASYRPLHQYNWCQKLEVFDHLEEVKKRLIEEPLAEKVIATNITLLEEITDEVSRKVRAQYEENPYPRWVKTKIHTKTKSISEVCKDVNLYLHSKSIKNVIAPSILIAGCGTGQHSIGTASRFSGCKVTAVDLSLASLAYAKRKTTELKITNLEYLQADILKLDQLKQDFDIIESVGVLHHMDEPITGWKVLNSLLKPGGLMKIGLYSELARQNIVKIRKEIKMRKLNSTRANIIKFRKLIAESHNENHRILTKSSDFFSFSMLRDAIFHVSENRFTLPQIKYCLEDLGLQFCGFENREVIANFRKLYGKEADIHDLSLWHMYEESNPLAFVEMYQFWCQKL